MFSVVHENPNYVFGYVIWFGAAYGIFYVARRLGFLVTSDSQTKFVQFAAILVSFLAAFSATPPSTNGMIVDLVGRLAIGVGLLSA
jgi:hypothetical protein